MVLLASDVGGATTWGSDAAMAAIDAEYGYLTGTLARPGKIIVWGYSMGGCNAINWTHRNPDKVAALILTAPASDLARMFALASTLGAEMAIAAADIKYLLSTTAGAAGYSTAQANPNNSLGK
jgi:alpha-beta hydrolase superfamily lysophospholipase